MKAGDWRRVEIGEGWRLVKGGDVEGWRLVRVEIGEGWRLVKC